MIGYVTAALLGACVATIVLALTVGSRDRELLDENDRLRAALEYLGHASREPAERRYIARVLDPDGEETGA